MPDLYTAFKQNGLSHCIPPAYKQRRYVPAPSYPTRTTTVQHSMRKDLERYEQTVPPEWRYGTSFQKAMQPMDRREFKALHTHAMSVFDTAIRQLDRFEEANRW